MTESIGTKLVELIAPIIPLILSETETDQYPYCTYEMTTQEYRDKDRRLYKIRGTVAIRIVSKDFSEADSLRERVEATLFNGMSGPQYFYTLTTRDKDRVNGVWILEINCTITQRQ